MSVRVLWIFAFACLTLLAVAETATARGAGPYCRSAQSGDDPMVFSSDFGVANCNARRAPRYHADDYSDGSDADVDSSDPMVWPADQWASDLFGGYRQSYDDSYDRRFRGDAHSARRSVSETISIDIATATSEASRHGFKIGEIEDRRVNWTVHKTVPRAEPSTPGARVWSGGTVCSNCRRAGVVRPATRCAAGGSLVITWTGSEAQYRCATPRSFHRWVR